MRGLLLALLAASTAARAQSVRVSGAASLRYIELRTLVRDSVPQGEAPGATLLRTLPDGRVVRCVPGDAFCRDVRPGGIVSSLPMIHDVEASAWGMGQGLRLHAQLRIRGSAGGGAEGALWPQGDDPLDVLAAFAELERERLRIRAGRQWKVSGLGFCNFDGLSIAARPRPPLWVEAYGGRSLARGLNEPRVGGALAAVEALAPLDAGMLLGVQARFRPSPRFSASAMYQIDVSRGDGVYAELAAADAVVRVRGGSLEGAIEADVAGGAVSEARVTARSPALGRFLLSAEARRYRPYFELWTIWGAFSPVGFDEASGAVTWAEPRGRLVLRAESAFRSYDDAVREESLDRYRSSGWSTGARATWSPSTPWRLESAYRVERGFGASRRDASIGVARALGDRGTVGLEGVLFERLFEFRLTEGRVAGLGTEAGYTLSDRLRVHASAAVYRHLDAGAGSGPDWSQRRASVRLLWTLGAEPGVGPRAGHAP